MTFLPNAHIAVIDQHKITDYLLARNHVAGGAKAAFFERFGFIMADWPRLRDALLDHARRAPIVAAADTPFGKKLHWQDRSPQPMAANRKFDRFGLSGPTRRCRNS